MPNHDISLPSSMDSQERSRRLAAVYRFLLSLPLPSDKTITSGESDEKTNLVKTADNGGENETP